MVIFYDSRKAIYRKPFGAVKAGETVRFHVDVLAPSVSVTLRLWVDGGEKLVAPTPDAGGVSFEYTPASAGLVWYYFIVDSEDGRAYYSGKSGAGRIFSEQPESYQLTVYEPYDVPAWFCEGIVYQIFPDRFFRSGEIKGVEEHRALRHDVTLHEGWDEPVLHAPLPGKKNYSPCDFYGGDLEGVRQKLPYLKSLGVSCIYLNPIFLSSSNHRYNTADYLRVDPMLGGDEALAALAREARENGMRLMLDGVFSHTGDDSVYFDRYGRFGGGAYSDPSSKYRDWYDFERYPDKYRCWWGFKTLPEVRETTPSYMEFIGGVLEKYATLGASSWRLDVADELPDEFIEYLRFRLKRIDPEGVLLGEVWEDASNKEGFGRRRRYVDGRELDSAMDYPFKDALFDFLLMRSSAHELSERLWSLRENYPAPFYAAQLNLIGSHDTVRALTALGGAPGRDELPREAQAAFSLSPEAVRLAKARLKLAAAVQFSLPGVPCIYYGDEAGASGMADPFNRATYPWGHEDGDLQAFYRALTGLRSSCAALKRGGCRMGAIGGDVFALLRGDDVLTLVNRAPDSVTITLFVDDLPDGPDIAAPFEGEYEELFTKTCICAKDGALALELPPTSALIFLKKLAR